MYYPIVYFTSFTQMSKARNSWRTWRILTTLGRRSLLYHVSITGIEPGQQRYYSGAEVINYKQTICYDHRRHTGGPGTVGLGELYGSVALEKCVHVRNNPCVMYMTTCIRELYGFSVCFWSRDRKNLTDSVRYTGGNHTDTCGYRMGPL